MTKYDFFTCLDKRVLLNIYVSIENILSVSVTAKAKK